MAILYSPLQAHSSVVSHHLVVFEGLPGSSRRGSLPSGAGRALFNGQRALVRSILVVFGEIEGQYADLFRIFDKEGFPPDSNDLFLGDYVDRGRQNIETIILMFCYKMKYPENFFMLRGNHEYPAINRVFFSTKSVIGDTRALVSGRFPT